jgi:hypothetical protein
VAATSLGHWLSSGEAGQVAAHRGSWKMWRAVGDAERAVSAATDAGAPVGDLPALVRRLHIVADEVEGIQRLAPARAGHDVAESQRQKMSDVVTAAHDIHRAAVAATGDMSDPKLRALVADANHEVQAIATGVARSREGRPGPD